MSNVNNTELPGPDWHAIVIRVPFANEMDATMAKEAIQVDKELQPHAVRRYLTVEGNELIATYHTLTVRLARLSTNSFLENVELVCRTIGEFGGDPKSQLVL